MTQPQDRADDELLVSTSTTTTTPLPCKQPLVKAPADHLQGGFKKHKMVHVQRGKKKKKCSIEKV
jgi:hypothetical protein